jgi:hypothetical protein
MPRSISRCLQSRQAGGGVVVVVVVVVTEKSSGGRAVHLDPSVCPLSKGALCVRIDGRVAWQ